MRDAGAMVDQAGHDREHRPAGRVVRRVSVCLERLLLDPIAMRLAGAADRLGVEAHEVIPVAALRSP